MTRFRAALFDLDGVLADTARAHFVAWKQIADSLGIAFDESANEALKGIDRLGSLDRILASCNVRLADHEIHSIAARKNELYLEAVAALRPDELLLPGALSLVEAIRSNGLSSAVASASRNAPMILDRAALRGMFDYVADPNRIASPKPAPDIFLDCAERLGVEPDACVAFEDSAAGIDAIRAAGMRAIGIGETSVLRLADQVYPATSAVDVDRVLAA
jgi:beta-phosphoglucomutase